MFFSDWAIYCKEGRMWIISADAEKLTNSKKNKNK